MNIPKTLAAAACILGICNVVSAPAQQGAPALDQALFIEWMVANCDRGQIEGLTVIVASMTINGSDPAKVEQRRVVIRDGMKNNYASVGEGCASLLASMVK